MALAENRTAALAAVALIVCAISHAAEDTPVALLTAVKGEVQIMPSRSLKPGQLLFTGDVLTCRAGGSATVHYDSTVFVDKKDETCPPGKEINIPRPPGSFVAGRAHPLGTLEKYAIGGRSKGIENAIYAPADGGAIVGDRFTIAWTTMPDIGSFVAVLLDPSGREIAKSGKQKGVDGTFDSAAFRRAILDDLAKNPASGKFKLLFQLDEGGEQVSTFAVLTKEQDAAVSQELAGVDKKNSLFAHIERAAIFDSHQMYNDLAAEYEKAVEEMPDSVTLLRAAATIDSKIGNVGAAYEYTTRAQSAERQSQ